MSFQLQERLEKFGAEGLPVPQKFSDTRPAGILERLIIFYYSLKNPVKCPNDGVRVKPTGIIIVEGQADAASFCGQGYKGFKTAEGKCGSCGQMYAVAGMSSIGTGDFIPGSDLPNTKGNINYFLFRIDRSLGFMPIPKGEVYNL